MGMLTTVPRFASSAWEFPTKRTCRYNEISRCLLPCGLMNSVYRQMKTNFAALFRHYNDVICKKKLIIYRWLLVYKHILNRHSDNLPDTSLARAKHKTK